MEIAGLVVGLMPLALQVADGTRKLRDAYRLTGALPSKLDRLTENLHLLQHIAKLLGRSNMPSSLQDVIIASSLGDVAKELERLSEKVAKVESSKKLVGAARRVRLAPSCQDELKHLEDLVHSAESKMLLGLAVHSAQRMLLPPEISSGAGIPGTQQHNDGVSSGPSPSPVAIHSPPRKPLSFRSQGCSYRKCRCRCHTEGSSGGRFWGFQYTPLSMVLADCDNPRCNTRQYKLSFRIALSQFGLKWAVTATAAMRSGGGSYSLDLSLRPQHIVRFTSDGFLLLFNILKGLISLDDGIASFKELYKNDPTLIDHVNPAGRGYIEELLLRPSHFQRQKALLRLFMHDFGMKKGLDNISLLYSCIRWIKEGPHIELFDALFDLGYNPSIVESPRPELWPQPYDPPDEMFESPTPDPFFIELMSKFVKLDPDFGGTSDLQYDILCHPAQALQSLANPMFTLDTSSNFLGQTPLHLAVTQSSVALALVEADHPLDEVDVFGLTPLMYAAGLGEIESAKLLISAGADFFIKGGFSERDFMTYAFARGQSEFIVEIILHLQSTYPKNASQTGFFYGTFILLGIARGALMPLFSVGFLKSLVQLAGDPNVTFDDPDKRAPGHQGVRENHLLHYYWPLELVQFIMESGFSLLNHKNHLGETALITAASRGDPMATRYFIEMGAEVSEHDVGGMSALAHCLWSWERYRAPFGYHYEISYPEVARVLLDAGADPCSTDSCDCACSTSGCTVMHMLPAVFGAQEDILMGKEDIWATSEWLHLLGDRQNEEVLRSGLLSLLRRSLFEELGMSHTCCRRRRERTKSHAYSSNDNTPTEDERVAIRAQQMHKSEKLNLQMLRMANLSTVELLCQWQQSAFQCHLQVSRMGNPSWDNGLKEWHQNICNFTIPETKLGPLERSKPTRGYSVDERGDFILQEISFPDLEPDKMLPFSLSLLYLEKLERAFYEGRTGGDRHERDAWYKRRLGWVLQFFEVLQVPQLYVREGLQHRLTYDCYWLDGKDRSDVMKHFLDSRKAMATSKMSQVRPFPNLGTSSMPGHVRGPVEVQRAGQRSCRVTIQIPHYFR